MGGESYMTKNEDILQEVTGSKSQEKNNIFLACDNIFYHRFAINFAKTIRYYAKTIQKLMFKDVKRIIFDNRKHMNGTQRKLLDVSLAKKYKWKTTVSLEDGLKSVINHFCKKNI